MTVKYRQKPGHAILNVSLVDDVSCLKADMRKRSGVSVVDLYCQGW
jgi:hypothetical protein